MCISRAHVRTVWPSQNFVVGLFPFQIFAGSFFCFEYELLLVAIMVFESYVVDLLNKFAGQYLENLDSSQLRIGIWGGGSIVAGVARAFVWMVFWIYSAFKTIYVDVYRRCPTGKLDLKGKRFGEFVCAICFCGEVVVCFLAKPTWTCTLQQLVVSVFVLHRLLGSPIKSRKNSKIAWTINNEVIKPH